MFSRKTLIHCYTCKNRTNKKGGIQFISIHLISIHLIVDINATSRKGINASESEAFHRASLPVYPPTSSGWYKILPVSTNGVQVCASIRE